LTYTKLEKALLEIGFEKYRALQVFKWLHQKRAQDFFEMTDLPKNFRERLSQNFFIRKREIIKELSDGRATKYLLNVGQTSGRKNILTENILAENILIESVLMNYDYGDALCVSTQAGCRMGCAFCASGKSFEGNLSAAQMEIQVPLKKIRGVVLMGSGEPLDNFSNVIDFIDIISDPNGLNLSERKITLSTCGLADKIIELADLKKQISLAVSLHAPNDEIRKTIMPVAKRFDARELLAASEYYFKTTKRRVTFEYALIAGINDSDDCAKELASVLKNKSAHVNLITLNPAAKYFSGRSINKFAEILKTRGVNATIRRKMGSGINAACGQLKANSKEQLACTVLGSQTKEKSERKTKIRF
jgi:23S rRNA (adenine2503-C2)-methyltransferase